MAFTQSFDVEFDDALLDLEGWKNPRYEGSKLTGAQINTYTAGDITYGKNPVIENKQACLFVGNTLIGQAENDSVIELKGHSFAEISKIILIDKETDETTVIERLVENEEAFNRFITSNLPEGASVNFKLLDYSIQNSLQKDYFVKFNRGLLMKIYTYTPNTDGYEDGVFGGYGISLKNPSAGSQNLGSDGLFGYGWVQQSGGGIISQSLFLSQSVEGEPGIYTQTPFPSELKDYKDAQNIHHIDEPSFAKSSLLPSDYITLQHFYNEWVFHDILNNNNNYFVTFEKGNFGIQNNKQESISTCEILNPQVNSSYNLNIINAYTNTLEPQEKTGMTSIDPTNSDFTNRNMGVTAVTSLRGLRYFQAEFLDVSDTSGNVTNAGIKVLALTSSKSYVAVTRIVKNDYSASFYYPYSQHQLSVLRDAPTVILNIDKETELYDGIGEKGFVITSEFLEYEIKNNVDFYLEKVGLIDKTTKFKTPNRGR